MLTDTLSAAPPEGWKTAGAPLEEADVTAFHCTDDVVLPNTVALIMLVNSIRYPSGCFRRGSARYLKLSVEALCVNPDKSTPPA